MQRTMLSAEERRLVLFDWNATEAGYPTDRCLHHLFEQQAALRPDAVALICGDAQVSYSQLEHRANQLARYLRQQEGVRPGVLVGLCMQRSIDLVVAILGVLKAGGAYVPIPPAYPRERIQFMLQDSGASLLITHTRHLERLSSYSGRTCCLDQIQTELLRFSGAGLVPDACSPDRSLDQPGADSTGSFTAAGAAQDYTVQPTDLAYVIYTSGSTGTPKGVLVEHRGTYNTMAALISILGVRPDDRMLQFAAYSFDGSILEMLVGLGAGAALVLVPHDQLVIGEALARLIEQSRITIALLQPSVIGSLPARSLPTLRILISGGEACTAELVARWAPGREMWNAYGPTEASVAVTVARCVPGDSAAAPPIGRPLPSTRVYILDEERQPVAIGEPGELYLGGIGVTRGYLNRPELTAERFLTDPFSPHPGARMYRSGDLGRFRPDGSIEYLGRIDHQVKLRGIRIELGEIEAALLHQPGVMQCAVRLREDEPGDKRLVAYVVPPPGTSSSFLHLRDALALHLPEFMLPAAFVALPALPLTTHGKIDRAALPPPGSERPLLLTEYVGPRTDRERALCRIFAAVLRLNEVGVHDDFFALGGHSLRAAYVTAEIAAQLGAELPIRALFEHPTVEALASQLSSRGAAHGPLPVGIPHADRGQPLPLSFSQQQVWLTSQLEPDSQLYNEPYRLTMRGPLHAGALAAALAALIERHEILRTTFEVIDGVPAQKVHAAMPLPLRTEDLRALDEPERAATLHRLHQELAQQPFDLQVPPLLRALLVRTADDEHRLLLTLHHAIVDGVSFSGVLLPELVRLYQAGVLGQPAGLPRLELQYADYAVWERRSFTQEALWGHLSYWRHQLADLPVLQLPTDHPHGASGSFRGVRHPIRLERALADGLAALARREGATLYMALLSGFAALLHRYSGQEDFAIAGVVSTQRRAELVGPFVNTVVLRANVTEQPSFLTLLRRTRETVLSALEHQDLPFATLVEALRPERRLGRHPLFQVLLLLDPPGAALPPGWSQSRFDAHNGASMCELSLQVDLRPEGLIGFLEYSSDLFEATTIARWAAHLEVLLRDILRRPEAPIAELTLLPTTERAQLEALSGGTRQHEVTSCLHELFAAQVERTPDATALSYEQGRLSYRELDRRANRLARRLQALGVGPDSCVGLCTERTPDLVIGVLGILKAGGAYVPLDPVYPRERLSLLLADTGATVLVAHSAVRRSLPPGWPGTVVLIDELGDARDGLDDVPVRSAATPDHLAYVIYTSGSTGKPKGVQITHRNVVRLFRATDPWFGFTEHDVWCLFHSFSFDFSVWELWGALLYGGRLVLVPYWVSRSAEAFYRLLTSEGVTVLNQTPSAFYQLIQVEPLINQQVAEQVAAQESSQVQSPLALRYVIFGGEALDLNALRPWFERHDDQAPQLVNMYGITETTVHVTYRPITQADCERPGSVIGVPIPDLLLQVLDRHRQPVPIGIPGELFVGGAGVARGYLNRPELTAERFITLPESDQRLYRSGDWVRYRADGDLEYLGRIDQQIKIRGFRIEIGEIEQALSEHPELRAAVVLLREDSPGDKRLVAYVVPTAAEIDPVLPARVRAVLEQKLPGHMVPAHILALAALPLTQNGKVDRQALPAPDRARPSLRAEYVAPRTFVEEELCAMFADVLGVEQVGVHDNFFELGGHSLLVIRVIFRVRDVFHLELPMRALFEAPTVAGLARHLETLQPGRTSQQVPPITPAPRAARLPLSFGQIRLWFLGQLLPEAPSYNEPITIRFHSSIDIKALERALDEVLRRHEAWRTTYQAVDGEPFQVVHPPAPHRLSVTDLRSLPPQMREAEALSLCTSEAHRPFDLVEGPLVRFILLLVADDDARLFMTFHHIVADGLSIYSVFSIELSRIYRAFAAGRPSPLPELPIQYADFALWQRRYLSSDLIERQVAYWRKQLGPRVPELQLPADRKAPLQPTFRGARELLALPLELTQRLRRLGFSEGATLFITLLTALKALFHRYIAQPDIVVGIVTAGRQRPELTPLLGFFPNTLVLRTELGGDPSFRALLRRVREVTLQAFDNQDVPFERVVEALNPERRPGEMPLFRVGFILDPLTPDLGNDWTLTSEDIEISAAKFDLGLELVEVPQGVAGRLSYRTELFEPATIQRMAGHYISLLESIAEDPDQALSRIPLLTQGERVQLDRWSAPVAPFPDQRCAHELFEAQVDTSPEAPALRYLDEVYSYGELEAQANRVAHALRDHGVGPGTLVGLCIERSPLLVVGMLGVLKAGGAFLPLDGAYPRERLAFMLGDAGAAVLLTEQSLSEQAPAHAGTTLLLDDAARLGRYLSTRPAPRATHRDLAYVIYTSGSTGKPKGVLLEHRGLCNSTVMQAEAFSIGPGDRVLQLASPGFDVAVFETVMALARGATLVMAPRAALLPGPDLIAVLREHEVTAMAITPSALAVLPLEPLPALRTLIIGGEPLPAALVERWSTTGRSLYNAYGPTEATICATLAVCRPGEGAPPIGRPLPNTRIYIVDGKDQPVPVGIAGEICIGGVGLARGYLRQPELTAARFVSDPFSADPHERLYRTGDLGRWRSDGQIEFLGRLDTQVKVRGFRIELGEIEAALDEQPEVAEAAVLARAEGGERHLVAYVVAAAGEIEPTPSLLRTRLHEVLPHHMVPSAIVVVPELPRTVNGKLDRAALAQLEVRLSRPTVDYRAPESDLEKTLTAIWQEVLRIERVGMNDNFFDLGGHSLLMAQVHARLREATGREVPLIALFQYPTIHSLASFLQGDQGGDKLLRSQERGRLRKEAAMQRRRATERKKQDEQ